MKVNWVFYQKLKNTAYFGIHSPLVIWLISLLTGKLVKTAFVLELDLQNHFFFVDKYDI